MSTQLFGDFVDLMSILKIEIENTFRKEINSVLTLKSSMVTQENMIRGVVWLMI